MVELTTPQAWSEAYPVLRQLRPDFSEAALTAEIAEMTDDGYRLFALRSDGTVVAVAGVALRRNLYYGRYLFVYDLVTAEHVRSQGYGWELLTAMEDLARTGGCDTVALTSGLQRTDAHRFYEDKAGYDRTSYAFVKRLVK